MGAQGTLTTLYRTWFILLMLALYGSTRSFLRLQGSTSFFAFYGSPMHSTSTLWCFPDNYCFFFCLVYWLAYYTCRGGWDHLGVKLFYTGMQNGLKLEI